MNATTIAVLLMLTAVFSGYLAAKWANNWIYWSYRWCGAAVIALAWMAALPRAHVTAMPIADDSDRDQQFFVAADVAKEAFRIMKEQEYGKR